MSVFFKGASNIGFTSLYFMFNISEAVCCNGCRLKSKGILFSMGILLILSIFFIVLIPFLFYLTTREVIKQLIVIK